MSSVICTSSIDSLIGTERSDWTASWTDGGSWAWSVGSSALTWRRHLDRVRPRLPLHAEDDGAGHLARRAVRVALGEPRGELVVLDAVDHRRRARRAGPACRCGRRRSPGGTRGPSMSWPVAWMLNARRSPWNVPVGRLTFASWMAPDTSSMPIRRAASRSGSTCTRTARFCWPNTTTWATPWTIDSRWARTVSAYSFTSYSGSVSDRRARIRIERVGRVHLPERRRGGHVGRQRPARPSRSPTARPGRPRRCRGRGRTAG